MTRLEAFYALKSHAWLGRVYARLTEKELSLAVHFLRERERCSKGEVDQAVQRMFLDLPKPKHWKEIQELLSCANSCT